MKHPIQKILAAAVVASLSVSGSAALAGFPERPVTMVVPFSPGTSTDTVSRLIAKVMGDELGQPVVVENRAGAGGSVGTSEVVKSAPDGYTIAMGTVGTLAINKSIFKDLPYDPEADVTPLSFVGYTPTLLVVSASSKFKSLDELVAASKKGNGITFASTGNGTSTHLAGELLKVLTGGQMVHVPFKSGAVGLAAVMSSEVDFMFNHPVSAKKNVEAGKLRALGVSGAKGSVVAPDVPPINDTYKGFDLIAWWLMHGPASLPDGITKKLNAAITVALNSEDVRQHFARSGITEGDVALGGLKGFISSEVKKWGEIAEAAKAKAD